MDFNWDNSYQDLSPNAKLRSQTFSTEERGRQYTLDYRLFFRGAEGAISPFHDIPLYANESKTNFNMVVEIPRWSNAKMEIATKEKLNPIKQDVKKGAPRYVHNCFPHHGYIWNYGALPQTWEDPDHVDPTTNTKGDNDPVDVCEIGSRVANRGEVIRVKVLGAFQLIDEGETDWKVLAIDIKDELADKLDDVDDIEMLMPGFLRATHEWLRIYKIPAGKKENQFGFNGEPKNKRFTHKIIEETHKHWHALISGKVQNSQGLALQNVGMQESPSRISGNEAESVINSSSAFANAKTIPDPVDKWHFVQLESDISNF